MYFSTVNKNLANIQHDENDLQYAFPLRFETYAWSRKMINLLSEGQEYRMKIYQKMKEGANISGRQKTKKKFLAQYAQYFKLYDEIKAIYVPELDPVPCTKVRFEDFEEYRRKIFYDIMKSVQYFQEECIKMSGKNDLLNKVKPHPSMELLNKEGYQSPAISQWIEDFFTLHLCIGRKSCTLRYSGMDFIPRFISDKAISNITDISESKVLVYSSNEQLRRLALNLRNLLEKLNTFLVSLDTQFDDLHRASKFINGYLEKANIPRENFRNDRSKVEAIRKILEYVYKHSKYIENSSKSLVKGLSLFEEDLVSKRIEDETTKFLVKLDRIKEKYEAKKKKLIDGISKIPEDIMRLEKVRDDSRERIKESASIKAEKYIRTIRIFQVRVASILLAINTELKGMCEGHVLPESVSDNDFSPFFYEDEDSFNNYIEKQQSLFDKLIPLLPPSSILDNIPESTNIIESANTLEVNEEVASH